MTRLLGVLAAAAALAVLAGFGLIAAAPAQAREPVEVSLDGSTWAGSLELDPFPRDFVFAPGASFETTLLLRTSGAAHLQVRLVESGDSPLWRELEVSTSITPAAPTPGEIAELRLRFTLPATADDSTQRRTAHPLVVVTASASPDRSSGASLPATGAAPHPIRTSGAVLALILILAGISICHNRGSAPPPSKEEPLG